jgi:hypothetical protein
MFRQNLQLTKKQKSLITQLANIYLVTGLSFGVIGSSALIFIYFFYVVTRFDNLDGPAAVIVIFPALAALVAIATVPFSILFILSAVLLRSKKPVIGIWFTYLSNMLCAAFGIFYIRCGIDAKTWIFCLYGILSIVVSGFTIYRLNVVHRSKD